MAFNKVVYGGRVLIDLTADTVTQDTLLEGYTAHAADGSYITGVAKSADPHEEIDRILAYGLTDGYKHIFDDGTITTDSKTKGMKLTKTFSNDNKTCTTVLRDSDGVELGRTVKTYSDDFRTIVTTNHNGMKFIKTFNDALQKCTATVFDPNGVQLAKQEKIFSSDGTVIETTVTYSS